MARLYRDDSVSDNETPAQPPLHAMGTARRDPRRGEIPVKHARAAKVSACAPGDAAANTGCNNKFQKTGGTYYIVGLA